MLRLVALSLLLPLVACVPPDGDGDDDPVDTADDPVLPTGLQGVEYGCNESNGQWSFLVWTGGTGDTATLRMHLPTDVGGTIEETHPFPAFRPITTTREESSLTLYPVAAADPYVSGTSTHFPCTTEVAEQSTWRVDLRDGTIPLGCAVWGADPAAVQGESCTHWGL